MSTSRPKPPAAFAFLCTLSPKRRAMLEQSPDLVDELLEARFDELQGTLVVAGSWSTLATLLGPELADSVTGTGGAELGEDLGVEGPAKVLSMTRVAELAKSLPSPMAFHQKLEAAMNEKPGLHEDVVELGASVAQLKTLYEGAAKQGHAMLIALALEDDEEG